MSKGYFTKVDISFRAPDEIETRYCVIYYSHGTVNLDNEIDKLRQNESDRMRV